MPAYIVVNVEITNPEGYQSYVREVGPSIEEYGGRYLARAGHTEVLEGDYQPKRVVIVEFSDVAKARSWWNSHDYAPAKAIRHANAKTDMYIVDGL